MVSPGFRLRPSLSVVEGGHHVGRVGHVSPGFRLRPSLSALRVVGEGCHGRVSPGFRLRPSLSGPTSLTSPPLSFRCRRGSDSGLR